MGWGGDSGRKSVLRVAWIRSAARTSAFSVSEMEATEGCWVIVWSGQTCVRKGEFWSLVGNLCTDERNRWGLSREVIPAWRTVPAVDLEGGRGCADQLHVAWVRKVPRMTPIVPVLSNDAWMCLSCWVCVGIGTLFIHYVFSPFILGHKIEISFLTNKWYPYKVCAYEEIHSILLLIKTL